MTKLHTQNAPDVKVIKPHFLLGAVFFGLSVVLMILAKTHLFGPYFEHHLLAIVHVNLLGWAMLLVFGSLYQLIPVVFETKLFSEKMAYITLFLTVSGVLFLAYGFWTGNFQGLFLWGALILYSALFLFGFNILMSYKDSSLKNVKSFFIIASIFWLFFTQTEGLLMALNFKWNILDTNNLYHLKIHAVAGLVGFFLQMIFGVGTTLIPMFLVSHKHSEKPLWPSFLLLNAGLLFLLSGWLFSPDIKWLIFKGYFLIVIGILLYLKFVRDAFVNRFKRILDEGMKPTMLMFIFLFLPIVLSAILMWHGDPYSNEAMVISFLFGFSMIFGVINMIILGQTYKTIPFIIWLDTYKPYVGKYQIPLPKEVYNVKWATWQFRFYLVYLILFIISFLFEIKILLEISLLFLILTSLIYNYNMIKMFTHKPILKPLQKPGSDEKR